MNVDNHYLRALSLLLLSHGQPVYLLVQKIQKAVSFSLKPNCYTTLHYTAYINLIWFPYYIVTICSGWTGLFCPCVLFGRNYETLREDYGSTTTPCVLHAIFIEGGLALAATTAALHGVIDPRTSFLICEGLLFSWWMCGIYTGIVRQMLQKKYHLKVKKDVNTLVVM